MPQPGHGQKATSFILVTMAIDAIGFGLIVPVMPALLKELLGMSAHEAAPWGGYLAFVYAAMTFLFGPLIGNLSDRFGRRPTLLLSLATLAVDYLIMGFAQSIGTLFLGRMLSGISGATVSTAHAYIADVTKPEHRAQAFGMVGAAFGIGFILGPAIGGFLGAYDPRAPFFAAAGLALLNMAYGLFVLPESLQSVDRRAFSLGRANPLGAFAHFTRLPTIAWFFVAALFFNFAHMVYPSTWNFHADARYGWGSDQIGCSLMAYGICSTIVQASLIGVILKRLGSFHTAIFGLLVSIIAFLGYASATTGWMVYLWLPISALGSVTGPAVNALMSERVSKNSQGELQGAMSSVMAAANMFSPIVMTQVFSFFTNGRAPFTFYGAAFLLAAVLTATSLIPFAIGMRATRDDSQRDDTVSI